MGTALVSAIMSVIIMVAIMVGFGTMYVSYTMWSDASRSAQHLSTERNRTAIQFSSATATADRATVNATLKNIGTTDIHDLALMDVFIEYTGNTTPHKYRLSPAQWSVLSLNPDTFQPGGWNPGETLNIAIGLPVAADPNTQGALVVATPNGVTVSGYVDFPADLGGG